MNRGRELAKNTMIISIGKIGTQFVSFLLLPLYTAKLTTEEYGTVDLLNTYISLLIPIIVFQIEQAIFRYLIDAREKEYEKEKLISTTFYIVTVQVAIFLFIYCCVVSKFIQNDYNNFLATNVVATIFSTIMLQIARGLGKNKVYSLGSFITASLTIVLNVIFIVCFNLGAYGMLGAYLIANIICSFFVIFKLKIYQYIKIKAFNIKTLKSLWKYSIPLIPNALSWWVMGVSDRTIITMFLGVAKNGIYSVANKFPGIFSTMSTIFSMSWTETVALHINDKDSTTYLSNTMDTVFRLFSSICFGIIACIPFIFSFIINENYKESYNQIPILMIGTLCNLVVILLSAIYVAKKMTRKIAQTSVISAIINIFMKIIGLYAASLSTAVAYFSMMIIRMFDIKRYIDIKYNMKTIISTTVITIFLFITYYLNIAIVNIFALIIVILYSILLNKQIINIIVNKAQEVSFKWCNRSISK